MNAILTFPFRDLLKASKTSNKFCNGPKSGPWMENFKTEAVGAECVCVRRGYENVLNAIMGGHSAGIA